ncbi:hypothetical protein V3C10_15075 [[Clostridium] symbiosum]|uniref:hypothetical protein n=1 Tax=Clostridium symbiosum TaxID=1512 RepID=UPI001D098372|nr:hypothetical protein [[Clostridium] symbiosum]MCB6610926.1 hypothetical protein [[Clostridium] symbiosum]MCB6931628.1 hypothetical protein [[Clostridium] symbiosum]
MEETHDNRYLPANNLLIIINEIQNSYKEMIKRSSNRISFDVSESDTIRNIAEKYNMTENDLILSLIFCCDSTIKQIEKINKRSKNKHMENVKGLRENLFKMFTISNGGIHSAGFDSIFGAETLLRLEAAVDFINDELAPEDVETEKISRFAQQVQELIKDVKQSIIDEELKNLILQDLCGVGDKLTKYMVLGMDAVYESVKSTVGALMMNYRDDFTEDEKGVIRKVLCLMGTFNTEFGFVKNVSMLTSAAIKLLK